MRKFLGVDNFFIRAILHTESRENITESQSTVFIQGLNLAIVVKIKMFEHCIEIGTEGSANCIFDSIHHPQAVVVINETITEDTSNLVGPQSSRHIRVSQLLLRAKANTTDYLTHITQVECVMRFQRRWFQVVLDLLVNL